MVVSRKEWRRGRKKGGGGEGERRLFAAAVFMNFFTCEIFSAPTTFCAEQLDPDPDSDGSGEQRPFTGRPPLLRPQEVHRT